MMQLFSVIIQPIMMYGHNRQHQTDYIQMSQEVLHSKLLESSRRNRSTLHNMVEQLINKRKQLKEQHYHKYEDYRKQYEELLKLNQQSEEETYRLKKELALVDLEIEQLTFRNHMSRSRIKDQNDEIENIKDETQDIDREKRKEAALVKQNQELKNQLEDLQSEVEEIEQKFDRKRRGVNELEDSLREKEMRREAMVRQHREKEAGMAEQISSLEQQLKNVKDEMRQLSLRREKQQKTKRNSRSLQVMNQIKGMLQQHKTNKSTNQNLD